MPKHGYLPTHGSALLPPTLQNFNEFHAKWNQAKAISAKLLELNVKVLLYNQVNFMNYECFSQIQVKTTSNPVMV